jgi:hypothetical protein
MGELASVGGGAVVADVVAEEPAGAFFSKKHLGPTRYEDMTLRAGLALARPFYDWISASWRGRLQRRDGVIVAATADGVQRVETEFFGTLVSETTLPALRAGSTEPGLLSVKLTPEYLRHRAIRGSTAQTGREQDAWHCGDFRLEVEGLQTDAVTAVSALSVRCVLPARDVGDPRGDRRAVPAVVFSDLAVSVPESAAQSWIAWHEEFVVRGDSGEGREKMGRLSLLSRQRDRELAGVQLLGLGIHGLGRGFATDSGHDEIVARLYCERMEFHHGARLQ